MSALQARIEELVAIAKAEHASLPDWYIQLTVEKYVKEEEYETYKDEIDKNVEELKALEENTSTNSKEEPCPC